MNLNKPITELFEKGKIISSVEFFPPKNEAGQAQILKVAKDMQESYHPDFVSITYGAGGTTREKTRDAALLLKEKFSFQVMPHLTCVGSSNDEILDITADYEKNGFRNILALRGDPPVGESSFTPHPNGPHYASDLVQLIKEKHNNFCIGVAAYPEKHPEAVSMDEDIAHLKNKVDAGASFITTQLFFDNSVYYKFVEKCRNAGIKVPILPGIMPPLSLKQVQRFCSFCNASLPKELIAQLKEAEGKEAPTEFPNLRNAEEAVGIAWALKQIEELLEHGAPGFHLYILNRGEPAIALIRQLRDIDGLITDNS